MRKFGKLVLVSEHFAPDRSTTATYVTAIPEGLSTDTEVLAIFGSSHPASVASLKAAQPRVVEVVTWTPETDALVRSAVAIVLLSLEMFFAILKHVTENDVVLCVITPFTLPYSVTLATKLRGASATPLIGDLYPKVLVMAGLVQPTSLVTRTLRFAIGLLFRALDTLVTIGRDVEALLLACKGVESRKIKFIPNWALLPIGYREIAVGSSFRRQWDYPGL